MSAELETVVVFDQNLYRTGHMANRWMHLLCEHFEANAKIAAPIRSGELKAGIESHAETFPEARTMIGTIASNAEHSMYVLAGTRGPIYTREAWAVGGDIYQAYEVTEEGKRVGRKGHWLPVGNRPWPPIRYRHSVAGQAANNFLFKAWRRTAHQHSVLRGNTADAIQF
jgi:hypothetical protein